MSSKARTIDNLGVDISVRYAQDNEFYDKELAKASNIIPKFTEQTITSPYYPSALDQLFGLEQKNSFFANFAPPENYFLANRNLFSYELIPSIGSLEKQEEEKIKIEDYKKKKKKKKKNLSPIELDEEEEEEKEKNILINLFSYLNRLDKTLETANAKRGQYHKG